MGKVKQPLPVKLIVGIISGEENLFDEAEKELSQKFGPLDFKSPVLSFYYTNHYEKEMGTGLKRKFISFQNLIDPAKIVEIKLFTNQLEENFLYPHSNQVTPSPFPLPSGERIKVRGKRKSLYYQLKENFSSSNSTHRRINLDPGYLTLSKLVLATTKNFQHRIYLRKGIYAEITLKFKRGRGFEPWEWTYPDYKSKEYLNIFNHLREIYNRQILNLEEEKNRKIQ